MGKTMSVHFLKIVLLIVMIFPLSGCLLAGSSAGSSRNAVSLHIPPAPEKNIRTNNSQIDYVVVQKQDGLISLWKDGRIVRTFSIMAMGANPVGHKVFEGDERTPEGQYFINEKHVSQNFKKFLSISYPNDMDRKNAKRFGVSPGGQVGLHGDRGGMSGFWQRFDKNWTDGCIALRNDDIEDVYAMVDVGTPILIKP